jgi:hypothetical protein
VALVACKLCGRGFINGPEGEDVCVECREKMKHVYRTVREFLRDHENQMFSVYDINRILGVPVEDVEGLVKLGWIDSGVSSSKKKTLKPLADRRGSSPLSDTADQGRAKSSSSMHTYEKKRR